MTLDLAVMIGGVLAALVGAAILAGIGTQRDVAVLKTEVKELKGEVKEDRQKTNDAINKVGDALTALQVMQARQEERSEAHEKVLADIASDTKIIGRMLTLKGQST